MSAHESSPPELDKFFGQEAFGRPEIIEDNFGDVSWHPERSDDGLVAHEATLAIGGIAQLRYRSEDWIARATEMRAEIIEDDPSLAA